jgi:hypothetical protein
MYIGVCMLMHTHTKVMGLTADTSNDVQEFSYRGIMIMFWFHKTVTQVTNS